MDTLFLDTKPEKDKWGN